MCEYYAIRITSSHIVVIEHLKYGLYEFEAYCMSVKNINL